MTQFAKLSEKAQNIVNNFSSIMHTKNIMHNATMMLGVSLYAIQSDADATVIEKFDGYIVDLKEYLTSNQIETLQSEYANVILACFDYECEDYMKNREMQMTPPSVVDLCLQLAQCTYGSNVYLPYSGMGEFSHKLQGCKCKGFEFSQLYWAMSKITNSACNVDCDIECAESGTTSKDDKFDYVFTCPPFGNNNTVVHELTSIVRNNLKNDGEMYAVLPKGICYSNGNAGYGFRKTIADINASIAVLALSNKTFQPYTGVSTCLIYVKNDGLGKVILSDFSSSDYIIHNDVYGRKRFSLKVNSIIESITNFDENLVWTGNYANLSDYLNMTPERYLPIQNMPILGKGELFVRLGDMIERLPNIKLSEKAGRPIIGSRELFNNYLNCTISAKGTFESMKDTVSVVDRNCILIGSIGGKIKVGKLIDASYVNTVAIRGDVFAVRISSDIITEDYFLRSLLSDYVGEQASKLSIGTAISRLSFKDLCNILIKVPSLEEQEKACYADAHAGVREADEKIQHAYDEFRRDVHMKKHAIGQTLANFKNWWNILSDVRNSGKGIIKEDAVIGRIHKVSVKEILDNIETSMLKLSTQLNKFDIGYGLIKEDIALTDFIENYIRENKSPLFQYDYNPRDHRSMDDIPDVSVREDLSGAYLTGDFCIRHGEPLEYIKFPKEALTTIFNDIVSNACAHGFANREDKINIVKIEIDSVGTDYIVTISNNGEPLNAGMKCDDIMVYGHTSGDTNTHYGIGGYEVKRLMEEFGDNVEIVSQPDEEFTVSYKLIFHDTNIIFAA